MSTAPRRTVRPRPLAIPLLFLIFTALLCLAAWLLGASPSARDGHQTPASPTAGQEITPPSTRPRRGMTCIVIDAGHGGEDGGASSAAGLVEKEVNLAVAEALRDLCETAGLPVVMTRTEDRLLYDRNVDYRGRKKALDLAARRIIAEETAARAAEDGGEILFVSIHMNAFPQPQYSGMQVWYSPADPRSAAVAESIQQASTVLMPGNTRQIKAAGSNIYLLDRLTIPAVLVECGFLSNPAEAERLADDAYRRALAAVIFTAIAPYVSGADPNG